MVEKVKAYSDKDITEVHLVEEYIQMGLYYFIELIEKIRKIRPDIHKGFYSS